MKPRLFITYSHDSEAHRQRVHALADRLRQDGASVILDRDCGPGGPNEGWDKWSEKQAAEAEIVLLVFTSAYRKCWDGEQPPGMRLGAIHETKVLYRRIYEAGPEVGFCRVVTFEDDDRNSIPKFIAGLHVFDATRDYATLIAWLRKLGVAPNPDSETVIITWPKPSVDYIWPLADRVEQFELFQTMITAGRNERILLLHGPSNSGKTVLLTELFKLAKALGLRYAQLDLKGCPALSELFDTLALEVGSEVLPAFHSASGSPRKTALLAELEKLCSPLLLGFDTYQDASADIADWIEGQFLRRAEHCPGLVVVLSGQKVPDRTRYPWGTLAVSEQLPPIKNAKHWQDYALRILASDSIKNDHVEMLLHIYKGDPGQTSAWLRSFAGARMAD